MEAASKGTQTTYTVYQEGDDDYENGKVVCIRAVQTVTHIDVDESSPEKIVAMLEFTPFSEIKENYVQIIDVPKRILKFASGSPSKTFIKKGALKKSRESFSSKLRLNSATHSKTDNEAQTKLLVSPHVLGDDMLPIVSTEESTQTDNPEYRTNLSFHNIIQHEPISGTLNTREVVNPLRAIFSSTGSYTSTRKFVSTIDVTFTNIERNILETMNITVKRLQESLGRMASQTDPIEEDTSSRAVQEIEEEIVPGDNTENKIKDILCECQCAGASGGAVPQLREPVKIDSETTQEKHENENQEYQCDKKRKASPNSISCPDLNERNIRLQDNKEKICHCDYAKSDTNNYYAGFKADRVIMPMNSTVQDGSLLVEQDGEYADSYLELLAQEQTGTQIDMNEFYTDSSEDSLINKHDCKCTPAIEMPWELITYDPKMKQKKTPPPKQVPEKEENVNLSPSTVRLKQLTVEAMDEVDLLELTDEALAEQDQDLTISEVERRITDIQNKDKITSMHTVKSEDSQIIIRPRIPPPRAKQTQVFEPSCERHNEPYMDRMYQYFPDGCEPTDHCPSHIEMPWQNIVLPKNCNIRKQYKPKNIEADKEFNDLEKSTVSRLELRISFNKFSSNMIPVENAARDQVSIKGTLSNTLQRLNRGEKASPLQASFSQPLMTSHKTHAKPCANEIPAKKSDLMRVLNFNDSKSNRYHGSQPKNSHEINKMHTPPESKTSNATTSRMNQSQRIALLKESCKKEMEPIKNGINNLRLRIQELNLPDVSSFQEIPQRPGGPTLYPGYSSSYVAIGHGAQVPYYAPPCWSPYYPYLTPYQFPRNYAPPQPNTKRTRRKPKQSKPVKIRSSSLTSSGADHSDLDTPVMEQVVCKCKKSVSRSDSTLPKKIKSSKIPKPIKRKESEISKTEVVGKRSSRSTNTGECCIAVSELSCGICDNSVEANLSLGAIQTCQKDMSTTDCNRDVSAKSSVVECGEQERGESVSCSNKVMVRNKFRIDLNDLLPINKYRKPMVDKSISANTAKEKEIKSEKSSEKLEECIKEGECD